MSESRISLGRCRAGLLFYISRQFILAMLRPTYALLLLVLALPGLGIGVQAQTIREEGVPHLQQFAPSDYQAHRQNLALVQDNRGMLFVGNYTGILEYDGVQWRVIPMPGGTAARSLAKGQDGLLYVGGINQLGYLFRTSRGDVRFVALNAQIPQACASFGDVWQTIAHNEYVYFLSDPCLFRWDGSSFSFWQAESAFHTAFAVGEDFFVRDAGLGLLEMRGDSLTLVEGGAFFRDVPIYGMVDAAGTRLILTREAGFVEFTPTGFRPWRHAAEDYLREFPLYLGTLYREETLLLPTLGGGVVFLSADGQSYRTLGREDGLRNSFVLALHEDRQRGLWMALDNGLARAEWRGAETVYGETEGITGSVIQFARVGTTLYVATASGLQRLEPARSPRERARFVPVRGMEEEIWALHAVDQDLLVATSNGLFVISGNDIRQIYAGFVMSILQPPSSSDRIIVGLFAGGLVHLERVRGAWQVVREDLGGESHVEALIEEREGVLWARHQTSNITRYVYGTGWDAPPELTTFTRDDGLPESIQRLFLDNGMVVVFGAQTVRFSPEASRFVPHTLSWVHRPTSIIGKTPWATDAFGLLKREAGEGQRFPFAGRRIQTSIDALFEDAGTLWLGTSDRVFRFNMQRPSLAFDAYPTVIRRVVQGDSVLYADGNLGQEEPRLAYSSRALRFSFAALSYDAPSQTRYQNMLEGFDQEWSEWSTEVQRDYTNLPEGQYVFRVRALDVYGRPGEEASFTFTILPPWYRTVWAYIGYVLLALLLGIAAVYVWTARLRRMNKRLEETVQLRTRELHIKNEENERLLLNILPEPIAGRLKKGEQTIADSFKEVTVLFSDIVGFTELSQKVSASQLVFMLNDLFSAFDHLAEQHGIEKIKTIGDAYMAVSGLPVPREDHAEAMAQMAIGMLDAVREYNLRHNANLSLRIGMHSGPVVAGVIGVHKFIYDLWGDTVNTAARMESHGIAGSIQMTEQTARLLQAKGWKVVKREIIHVKGKGEMATYLIQ